jgi:hypothetical protein
LLSSFDFNFDLRSYMMGAGDHGQLGQGDTRLQTIPVVLATLKDNGGFSGGGGGQ